MPNSPTASVLPSSPEWKNWSENLVYKPVDGEIYYYAPENLAELKSVLADAARKGVTVRVSGQRHSQPPLVVDDNRGAPPAAAKSWLVDLSCYADLGAGGNERIVLGPGPKQVTVNAGVREDDLDAFLTAHNLMLQTVTAGGFFSLGGMTAVDVHGGTVAAPIFAETVSAFTILLADGSVKTIDAKSPAVGGWSPLQFARVSLGGLGIVTSVTIDVLDRRWATTLQGGTERLGLANKSDFVEKIKTLVSDHARLEVFFTPYATEYVGFPIYANNYFALWWDVVANPPQEIPNATETPESACELANKQPPEYGAPGLGYIGEYGADVAEHSQYYDLTLVPPSSRQAPVSRSRRQVAAANTAYQELWLTGAVRVIFMSYFIPLPGLDDAGLGKVWDGLDVVSQIVLEDGNFHIAAPMEFRFVKGGDTAMAATYTEDPENTWFINLDLIGFVEQDLKASAYPTALLQFFADVERKWVAMGGFPHQGKMYGFYDPTAPEGTHTAPFNANFLADLRGRRGERLQAFNGYRKSLDPNGLFCNDFLRAVLEG